MAMTPAEYAELRELVLRNATILSTPIDYAKLVEDGILKPHGEWWEVRSLNDLPEPVGLKLKAAKQHKGGGMLVKFHNPTKSSKKLAKALGIKVEDGEPEK